jgi:hypothetical protein
VFYDRRNYNDNKTDVYMAVSKDGGESFENFKISNSPFVPNSGVFFGDYTGISAHNNIVRPIWTRLENSDLSVWTAIIDPYFSGSRKDELAPYAIEQTFPNPFSESAVISFKIKEPTLLSLEVFDLFGHKVSTLIEPSIIQPGKYIKRFDAANLDLPSGVYYFSLTGNGTNIQRKIIYHKR